MAVAGGYEYIFVDPPDELVCMVCHHVAKEAHQVECCGKVFCKTCIMEVNERMGSCPNCRVTSPKIFSDLRGIREIKRLKVSCGNEEKGCDWTGALDSYETHEEECGFKEVNCPNSGCSEAILRRVLEEHLINTCPRRKEKCTVCDEMVAHEDKPTHPSICPKVEIECNNSGCSLRLFREQLTAHQCVCPKQIISCPYEKAGCSVEILREDRQKHLKNIEQHSTTASNTFLSLKKELADVRKQLKEALESKLVLPVTFKMPNYRHLKGESKSWKSPCFYTHPGGYKMRFSIEVNPQGDDDARDHLSLYCRLISSYNDDSLPWPFAGEITIQILNQCEDSGHHSQNLDWDGADETVTKNPSIGERNHAWGLVTLISHAELEKESNSYLKNGCVYFRVLKVSIAKSWLTCS